MHFSQIFFIKLFRGRDNSGINLKKLQSTYKNCKKLLTYDVTFKSSSVLPKSKFLIKIVIISILV